MLPAFTSLGNAWLFALLVPLIAFYFLKLKRPRVAIPSLVLWRQVLNDQRVNSPFQRFKRNLLLLLQILILALLVLAAMQPFLRREAARAHRLPVLIDVSASMGALDHARGTTRLDEVKRTLRERIDGLLPDQELCLVAFGKTAHRLTPFTNNHRELRDALDALTVEDVPSDVEEALRLAQALGRTEPFDKVLLLSDGNLPTQANFELPFQIDFQKTTPGGSNFGIVAFSARRAPGGHWQVFVQLAGSANAESTTGTLELRQEDKVIAHEDLSLTRGSSPRLAFDLAGGPGAILEARLRLNDFDSLAADDTAWLTLPATRPLAIFVPENLAGYRHALAALEDVNVFPQADAPTPAVFDLVISDHEEDMEKPARVRCAIGIIPVDVRSLVTIEGKSAQAIDWRRDSPLLQHVSLRDVVFMEQPVSTGATTDDALAQLGYEILAQGEHGPLMLDKHVGETLHIALLFHTDRSTLPFRVGFPIFVSNLVQIALHESGLSEAEAARTGVLNAGGFTPNASCSISGPANFRRTAQADELGRLSGLPAPHAGEYTITASGGSPQPVGASLLSTTETSLAAVDQLQFNDQLTVAAATAPAKSDRTLWWIIAFAAFLALLVEWWWFQRPARVV
ncbi:MAG: VWA domain-containing protein [Chthoniobacter sp.]|uniref:VWA domain-containing protein n=1 Tax=Chthoniobacter sp. TaxID=2510640 RepID=UPI0032A6E5FD